MGVETTVLDFGSQLDYLRALLPEVVLAVAAVTVLLVDAARRRGEGRGGDSLVPALSVGGVLAAAAANLSLLRLEPGGEAAMVALDGLRVGANFVILAALLLGLLFSLDYLRREELAEGEYHALFLLSAVGMMVLVGAQDLVLVFLGLETMSIPVYVLTAFDRREARSAEAGLKYFLVGAFATAFFVYGVALLYGATGETNLLRVGPRAAAALGDGSLLVYAGVGLVVVGFGFKVAAVPFHMWAPDAYQGAPTPVTGYMAAGVKAAGFLALIRVVALGLGGVEPAWEGIVWWLALLSMILPNLVALVQDDVKRMLAYSSLSHAGYVLVGVAAGGELGRAAAVFYLAVYTLMTVGAFAVVSVVAGRRDRRSHLSDFRGFGWSRPLLGGVFALFLLSLAGFPPTGGFVGKLYLLRAAVDGGEVALAVTLVLTSLVAYYYYARVIWKMYFEEVPEGALPGEPASGLAFRTAATLCAVGILAAGIVPGPALRASESAAEASSAPAAVQAAASSAVSPSPSGDPGAPGREAAR